MICWGLSCKPARSPTGILVHKDPSEDEEYNSALDKATREASVYGNFETKMLISATFLSPAFRQAFNTRYEQMMGEKQLILARARNKAGFFVSVFTPEAGAPDLNNSKLWALSLRTSGGQHYLPSLVQRLTEKKRWRPFFPWLNKWSGEYLILFDTDGSVFEGGQSPAGAGEPAADRLPPWRLNFSIASPDARVSMGW